MNKLSIVQRLVAESGVTGMALNTTVSQRGEMLNFVNWADDAWLEVQGLRNWPSLWEQASIAFAANSNIAAQSVAHSRYEKDTARINGATLDYLTWAEFKESYPTVGQGTASAWTIRPDRSIALNAFAAGPLTMTVERYKQPKTLESDASEPDLFPEHHMMIVWRALMLYAGYDEASTAYKRGAHEYSVMKRLASRDSPALTAGAPLL